MKNVWKTTVIALAALLVTAGMTGLPQNECRTGSTAIVAAAEESVSEYTVNIKLMQFHNEGLSMGNASMNPEAHIIVKHDGTAEIQIDMVSLTYLGKQGYLGWLKKVTKVLKENDFQYPTEIESTDADVLEEYVDVYDDFNKEKSKYADSNVVGKWYPKKLGIPINFNDKEDDILVQVYVPVMESIMPGGGTKFAVLDIDWDSLKQIAGESQTTTEPAQTTTETSQTTTTTAETTTTDTTTTTTTTKPAAPSAFDKDNLTDGKYELQAEMIKADRSGYSMSNNGINHTVQLEVKGGEYFVTMQFKGLAMYNQFGYLKNLYYYNKGYTYNQYGKPEGNVTLAEVISTYDVVDQYNDANNLYPQLVRFPLVEKANDEFVPLRVFVPIMEAIADGTGTQSVLMELDWSTLTKTEEPFQIEEQEEQSNAFDYTSDSGVKLHADQGVLPNNASATVSAVTSGSDYDTAKANLSNFNVYSVAVSADLNGKMQISLPIPSGVSEPLVYRIADGKKTKINGTAENGMFTFSVKETGTFAIGAAVSGSTNNSGSTITTTTSGKGTTSPQTGDAGVGTVAAGMSLAAIAAYITRRKKK